MAKQEDLLYTRLTADYWINEVELDVKHGVLTENLVDCLKVMLEYIRQLEKKVAKLEERVEELEERVMELEEVDSDG